MATVGVLLDVGVGVGVSVGVGVLVAVLVAVGVSVGVLVEVLVGIVVAVIVASCKLGSSDSPALSRSLQRAPSREKTTAVEDPAGSSNRKRIVATLADSDSADPVSFVAEKSIRPRLLFTWLSVAPENSAGFSSIVDAAAPSVLTTSRASGSNVRYASTVSADSAPVAATSVRTTVDPDGADAGVGSSARRAESAILTAQTGDMA